MRPSNVLAQLTLWASTSLAFYPFDPEWHLKLQQDQTNARRTVDGHDGKGIVFPIKQRAGLTEASTPERLAREIARLSRKYRRVSNADSTPSDSLRRRDNEYHVDEAADPGTADTEGVDQDGTDYSYFVTVEFGSGGKELYMLIDTGAGSSWVMGASCDSKACNLHDSFGPKDSDTFKTDGGDFSVSYGSGAVSGKLVTDTIKVAGMSFKYQFGVAAQTSDDFEHFAFDGILGLSMSHGANDNFLQTAKESNQLDKDVFAVALSRADDGPNKGEISFGTIDESRYTGDITYTGIGEGKEWAIQIDNMAYDGNKADVGGVESYIDTGTSFVFGPPDLVKKVHSVIPDAESSDGVVYKVPCDSDKALTFTFSGVDFEVSPKDWISPKNGDGKCTSNIYGQDVVSGSWLLGDTFLKNVYAVFDMGEKKIGFASRSDVGKDSTPSASASSPLASVTTGPSKTKTPKNSSATATATASTTHPVADTASSTKPHMGLSGHETHATTGTAAAASATSMDKGGGDSDGKDGKDDKDSSAPGGHLRDPRVAAVACIASFIILLA